MRIVIAGGSGLIGRGLTESFARDGNEVTILSRNPDKVGNLRAGAKAVFWDVEKLDTWAGLIDGADALVNLAGASIKGDGFLPSRWTQKRKQLILQSRVDAGRALVEAIKLAKQKPKVFVQSSAVGYYGPRGDELIDEDTSAGTDFLASVCKAWETSTSEVESLGVRRVIIRTGLPLTLKGGAFPLLLLPFRLFSGNWFGSGRQYYPWIHFDDCIAALRFLVDQERANGGFNISAPEQVTNKRFAKTLGKVMSKPVWVPVPAFAMKLALGEVSTVVLDGQRVVPDGLTKLGFTFKYPSLEPALRNLLRK